MAISRKVQGYVTDSARPNWKKDVEFDLDNLGAPTGAAKGTIPAAQRGPVTVVEGGDEVLRKTTLNISNLAVTMTDAGAAGCHGSVQLYDFPVGLIQILGATLSLATAAGAGGIADNAAVVQSVGTAAVATDNASLSSTEADIIPSTAGTLAAGINGSVVGVSTTPALFDGHNTAKDAFLNFAIPDAGSSASDTLTVTGTVVIYWLYFGDV